MPESRRSFLKQFTCAAAGTACCSNGEALAAQADDDSNPCGVLVDTSLCVGCRRCEAACNEINEDLPRRLPASFQDESTFSRRRRMDDSAYTVVNRYPDPDNAERTVYAKFQCMHCLQPACVSACIVGALSRQPDGAVTYDSQKCIGCRYCMVACPFQVPAYEYRNSFTPKVRKCHFCHEERLSQGSVPACVEACPMQTMTFGRRNELIELAGKKMKRYPDRYVPHLYGAHEVGGTAWMYMSGIPFRNIDLPEFGYHPVPGYTEPVQHIVFRWMLPPLGLYAILGGIMWFMETNRKQQSRQP